MRTVTANAFEADAHPEGGHVVVLLHDVSSAPEACEFRIKPSDQDGTLEGWPKGVLKPLDAKATPAGLELLIGPDVTNSPVLAPGTGVEIELPSAALRAEFVWPLVTTTRRQKKRNLVAHSRNGKNGRGGSADHLALVVPTPATGAGEVVRLATANGAQSPSISSGAAREPAASADFESTDTGTSAMSSSLFSKLDALDAIAGLGEVALGGKDTKPPEATVAEPAAKAAPPVTVRPSPSPAADDVLSVLQELKRDIVALKQEQAQQHLAPGEQQLRDVLAELRRDIVSLKQEQVHQNLPAGERELRDVLAELKRDIVNLRHEQSHEQLPPGEQQLRDVLADLKRDIVALKHEQAHGTHGHVHQDGESDVYAMLRDLKHDIATLHHEAPATPAYTRLPVPQAAGILGLEPFKLLAFGVPLIALALVGVYSLLKPPVTAYQPAPTFVAAPVAVAQPAGNPATPVYDALSSGSVSPRGVNVAGVDAQQALGRATALLSAPAGQKDAEEARFWLKRYLAIAHADKPVIRAITQLGTVYAQPGNGAAPDYGKARDVWEISSALGDPVAMCFIGNLFEYGLGVGLSRPAALSWYERAKAAGGCTGLEESMARVKL